MAEGVLGIKSVEADHSRAEHQAVGEPCRIAEGEVDFQMRALNERLADGLGLDHPHSVEFTSAPHDLEEARQLPRGGHHRGRRHDAGEEAGIVGEFDQTVQSDAEGPAQQIRQRWRGRRAGDVVDGDLVDVLGRDAVVGPAEPQRIEELLGEHLSDVLTGGGVHDLAEDESAGDRVIGEIAAGLRERRGVDQDVGHVLAVAEVVEIECAARKVRHPGAVIEDVSDGDLVLTVLLIAGDVVGDGIVDAEHAQLGEFMNDEGGDGLRCGVDTERGIDGRVLPLGVLAVLRAVAVGVSNRPVEDHRAVASDAHLHGRMYTAAVPVAD